MTIKEQVRKERHEFLVDFFKNIIYGVVVAFVALGIMFAFRIVHTRQAAALATRMEEVNSLNASLTQNMARQQEASSTLTSVATSLNNERKATDDAIVQDYLNTYLNFSSLDDAVTKTADAQSVVDFSQWFQANLLVSADDDYIKNSQGQNRMRRSEADPMSQTVRSFESYVTNIKSDVYTYHAVLSYTRTLAGESGDYRALLWYDVNSNGTVSNLSAMRILQN